MACLATGPGLLVPTTTLASKTNVPANYLAKVLQQLANAGLIHGRRGVGGGYRLAHNAGDINLLEIVRAVGELEEVTAPAGSCDSGSSTGTLQLTLDRVKTMVTDALEGVTLQSLVSEPHAEAVTR